MIGQIVRRALCAMSIACVMSGCAITDEFNRQGGFTGHVLDKIFLPAEAREHRVFRSYLLIGILARIGSESPVNLDDRQAVAFRIAQAIQASNEALVCARDATCVFLEDRLAILDRRLFRLAIAVLYPEETRDLLAKVRDSFAGKIPVAGRAASLAQAAVTVVGEGSGVVNEAASAVNALLDLSFTAFEYGQRLGPLYRDSMELDMRIFIETVRGAADANGGACPGQAPARKGYTPVFKVGVPVPAEGASYCALLDRALSIYRNGTGPIPEWRRFLSDEARGYAPLMTPAEAHWVEASDLIWRGCDLLVGTDSQRTECRAKETLIYWKATKAIRDGRQVAANALH